MSIHYKDFKDLNEFHVSRVRGRQKYKGKIQAHMSVTDQNQNKESKQVKHKISFHQQTVLEGAESGT